jgi:integrase
MARRRGKGEGSIRERADGRWEVRIDLGRGIDGKRRQKSAFAPTQGEAVEQLRKLGGRAVNGQLLTTSTPTVAKYLEDWYAANADTWRPSTKRGYRGAIDLYLTPAFGPLRLEQLTPLVIQRWLTQHKTEHGARRRITLAHSTLRSAATHHGLHCRAGEDLADICERTPTQCAVLSRVGVWAAPRRGDRSAMGRR